MRIFLFTLISFCLSIPLYGQNPKKEQTIKHSLSQLGIVGNYSVIKESSAYCIVSNGEDIGYVIISMNDNSRGKILGYSYTCNWVDDIMPTTLLSWLDSIDYKNKVGNHEVKKFKDVKRGSSDEKYSISPLLSCHWHQKSPYNDLAPVISDGNVKTAAGCVAIAAAQVVYYWRRDNPAATLMDTPVYPYGVAPVIMSIPMGTANNWDLMCDSYDDIDSEESRYAVAQLCYVIGTSSYLNYASSTGGHIYNAANALYCQYNISSNYISKQNVTQSEWEEIIYNELTQKRPIICAGSGGEAHAFVLDGYDKNTDLYHFNFGWGGAGDGYYLIDDSDAAMGGYYQNQSILYDIHPLKRNVETNFYFQNNKDESSMMDVEINIKNHSTLDINGIKLFVSPEGQSLEDAAPVWQDYNIIMRDEEKNYIAYGIGAKSELQNYYLYLTDENCNILGQIKTQDATNVRQSLCKDPSKKIICDLFGRTVASPKKGVFIIQDGNNSKKVLIK